MTREWELFSSTPDLQSEGQGVLETLSSIKTLEQEASDGFQVGEHSEAQGGWCTPTPHGLLLSIFVDFALCISLSGCSYVSFVRIQNLMLSL